MSSSESSGAKGKMELHHSFWESASGHVDDSHDIILKAKNENTIQLVEEKQHSEFLKSGGSWKDKKVYEIDVNKLISLIEKYGIKVD
ncbi:hypothetical protein [Clostridium saccharoperbutylacetonicum]